MNLLKHLLLSIILCCLVFGLLIAIDKMIHEPGDIFPAVVLLLFPLIALGLILFYVLTSFHNAGWTCVNFAVNIFVFRFQTDYLHENGISEFLLFVVCALLWAVNKILIDKLLDNVKVKRKPSNKLDTLIHRARAGNTGRSASR